MPTTLAAPAADIEEQIDAVLEQEQSARTEKARAAVRARFIEEERIAIEAKERAEQLLKSNDPELDYDRAQDDLQRAVTRLKVATER